MAVWRREQGISEVAHVLLKRPIKQKIEKMKNYLMEDEFCSCALQITDPKINKN